MSEEAVIETEATNVPSPVEDKARRMGWTSKEEFKGDPERWVDAETFVRRGDEVLPIVRAEKRKLEELVEKQRGEIAEMKRTFSEFRDYHSKTEQRAMQRAMRELEERQAQLVEANDVEGVRAVTKEIAELAKEAAAPAPKAERDEFAETLATWKADNAWYDKDLALQAAAHGYADKLTAQGVSREKQLEMTAKWVRESFPEKFENPNRRQAAAVEGGTTTKKTGRTWSDLPVQARDFGDRLVKQGLLTREQYLKDYEWDKK